MYFCLFVYLSLKDIFVNICTALLCNGIKHIIIIKKKKTGRSRYLIGLSRGRKILYVTHTCRENAV